MTIWNHDRDLDGRGRGVAVLRQGLSAIALATGLVVSGCATSDSPTGVTESAAPPTQESGASEAALSPDLVPVPDPASLVGYDGMALEKLLGLPSFIRRDAPAELWQYRNETCTLDLFLYEESAGSYSVEHLEFRETALSKEAIEHCLRAIMEQKTAPGSAA